MYAGAASRLLVSSHETETRVKLFFLPAEGNALDIAAGAVERQGGTLELIVDARLGNNKETR